MNAQSRATSGGTPGALAPYRILDLTDHRGWLAGKMLGDLGADIIKIEPVNGDPGRHRGPFFKDKADSEHSLKWWFFNQGKQGVSLNLESEEGKALFKKMVAEADAVVESFEPGWMDSLGLGYKNLEAINPKIVMTSITAFGQGGPHAGFKGPDLILAALCGTMYLCGDPERPPVRISVPQGYMHGAAEGAVSTTMGLYHARSTGVGQHADVSSQHAYSRALMNATPFPKLENRSIKRTGIWTESVGSFRRVIYPAKDGFITMMINGGILGGKSIEAIFEWAGETIEIPEKLLNTDWQGLDAAAIIQDPAKGLLFTELSEWLMDFYPRFDKETIYAEALKRRILLAPVSTVADICADEQLDAREYFVDVEHEEQGSVTYPGQWAKMSGTELRVGTRAPHVGEHNRAIFVDQMGVSEVEFERLVETRVL